MALRTVRVPAGMEEVFGAAEEVVSRFFAERVADASKGTIEIFGERYVLVRAASLSVEFFELVEDLFGEGRQSEADAFARNILFDLAHSIGRSDAQNFHSKMSLTDPIARLSAGPVHFAHAGWAFVDISPESRPAPDESFCLVYEHPYSFEADAWTRADRRRGFPACIMNAGYSSGWCEASFGVELVATEILCRARGDDRCRFLMGHPTRIEALVREYLAGHPDVARTVGDFEIPDFFARKRVEEELRQSHAELEARVEQRTAELRASEQQLRQVQKLEAIGRLAGGIAHDFNNLMGVVLARAGLLDKRMDASDPAHDHVVHILAAARRAAALTQQLLAFSRTQVVAIERVDPTRVIGELAQLLLPLIGEHIELRTSLAIDAGPIEIDRGQLEQIVMNLAVNSRDAMPSGGTLEIAAREENVLLPRIVTSGELAAGRYVCVTVADTGVGMDAETLARVFDPFFTTKPDGTGTGLGLSTVHGVVHQCGGRIDVASEPGRGTRFALYFPRAAERDPSSPEIPLPPPDAAVTRHPGATILVVEDQDDLRDSLALILRTYGYDVLAARSAEEALLIVRERGSSLAAIVTDVVMPRMAGPELATRALELVPHAKVLFMSGYAPEHAQRAHLLASGSAFLQKPFMPRDLARKLDELLDARAKPE